MQPAQPTRAAQDQAFMQQALKLAAETIVLASPNPQVGCVLTQTPPSGGVPKIIGEGAHLYANRDHAEIVALKQAAQRGLSTVGATAYVTLEPCSHHGRTGPCADALIAAGVSRCVVATQDPNPQVSGEGLAKLRAAGIEVTVGLLQQHARDLNDAFAHFIQHRTPFVTLKAALSVDGKLAPPPASRFPNQPHWLTGPAARYEVQLLRHASDAVLTGIGTVLADDPQLTDRSGLVGPNNLPRRRPLLRVILDTQLRIPLSSQLVRSANNTHDSGEPDLLILCGKNAPNARITALTDLRIQVETLPDHAGRLSLPAVLSTLAERNILSLLLECGSHLNGAFLQQNLVDKAVLIYAETELGDQAIPFAQGIGSPYLFEESLHRVTRANYGPDACVTGYLHDPWPNPVPPPSKAIS
ncbi:bifunctional diaminohydroxyphosphoribosylaminopyrimidine deaminase/5-amino-6-(5-phosphoribosylamino)uracil reductase RibD [Tunturiibacter gelidoferens]|uniref:Riboflavin biosynthesis protein RibD n=2 Tax=Tunturiibacter TaxID=3154218 RepID=A0A7Y9NLN5_9BACT|nr:bifunctional diaminohydroxyphosphoribosylaminopyrimidine deaminase/5-amino-6-(5-phosphoribosylamino)uracil reductase RibD [Edaphobacter lichenicola]MBB5339093.1 diaminohydroxyphosphoribosylaminopyrimidine deaminase/5-amino-6-(5-phosphoribosylamino)uracil reductase [Edaphobacter lichenicola]NYF51681.1 diaminohydroxyphosphoribosylaminopyrimidine deaminase/5-amino-6-(5-phosphoribosylamino)uracil reductase [Edaphobacter lichenicola]